MLWRLSPEPQSSRVSRRQLTRATTGKVEDQADQPESPVGPGTRGLRHGGGHPTPNLPYLYNCKRRRQPAGGGGGLGTTLGDQNG